MKHQIFAPGADALPLIDIKAVREDGEFEGYASVFGVVDLGRDIVAKGAFAQSLQERGPEKVKMLWAHDTREPIGRWLELREDNRGLKVKGKLNLQVQRAIELRALMLDGAVDGMSIGGMTMDSDNDRAKGARIIKEFDLWEISIVTFAMNPKAGVSAVKDADGLTERGIEALLRDAGLSRTEAKALLADGFKALKAARDVRPDSEDLGDVLAAIKRAAAALS